MKKYLFLLAIIVLASCTKEEDYRSSNGRYTLTVSASKALVSKALSLSGSTLSASWTQGDVVEVYKGSDKIGTLTAQSSGASHTAVVCGGTSDGDGNVSVAFI